MNDEKKYNEALERARKLYEQGTITESLCYVFPELKESEDERIKKCVKYAIDKLFLKEKIVCDVRKNDVLAWLEKQGEQDPYNGVSFKYNGHTWGMCARDNGVDILLDRQLIKHLEKQGEKYIENYDEKIRKGLISFFTERAKYTEDSTFNGLSSKEIIAWLEKQDEKKPAEWSEKDESTTEDLGEYINELSKQFPEVSFAKLSRIAMRVAKWQKENLWKPADGEDLPIFDREVIALLDNGKVVFAHRPPEYWDGKNIATGKVTRYYPKTYDKGGWNIPDIKWWLDVELPKEIEL